MPFEIKEISETSSSVEIGETLWLTEDRETVVHDGDPEAAHLLATAGKRLSREEAERYGLVKAKPAAKAKAKPAAKEAAPAEDKAGEPGSE